MLPDFDLTLVGRASFSYDPEVQSFGIVSVSPRRRQVGFFEYLNGRSELKATMPLAIWKLVADPVKAEFNTRMRKQNIRPGFFPVSGAVALDRLLGKEITLLAWMIEGATPEQADLGRRHWQGLRPEERWWLYTTANASSNQPGWGPDRGWRLALRIAFTDDLMSREATYVR